MSDLEDNVSKGGAPKYADLPDNVEALYVSVKNTWQDAENLDGTHGYISYAWIPEETFKVNIMKLRVYAEKFRAYSTGAAAGGGTTETSTYSGAHRHLMFSHFGDGGQHYDLFHYRCKDVAGVDVFEDIRVSNSVGLYTYERVTDHRHDVAIPDHEHAIVFGIYEENITGRTLSAALYDPDGELVHDFGVILTGEGSVLLDLSEYFETLKYGMWELRLEASDRLRARLIFYELCLMYAY